jgi:uncharacterized ubiquitin-like protein YukD
VLAGRLIEFIARVRASGSLAEYDQELLRSFEDQFSSLDPTHTLTPGQIAWIRERFLARWKSIVDTAADYTRNTSGVNEHWIKLARDLATESGKLYFNFLLPITNTIDPGDFSKLSNTDDPRSFFISDDGNTLYRTKVVLDSLEKHTLPSTVLEREKNCQCLHVCLPPRKGRLASVRPLSLQELLRLRCKEGAVEIKGKHYASLWDYLKENNISKADPKQSLPRHMLAPILELVGIYFSSKEPHAIQKEAKEKLLSFSNYLQNCSIDDVNVLYAQVVDVGDKRVYLVDLLLDLLEGKTILAPITSIQISPASGRGAAIRSSITSITLSDRASLGAGATDAGRVSITASTISASSVASSLATITPAMVTPSSPAASVLSDSGASIPSIIITSFEEDRREIDGRDEASGLLTWLAKRDASLVVEPGIIEKGSVLRGLYAKLGVCRGLSSAKLVLGYLSFMLENSASEKLRRKIDELRTSQPLIKVKDFIGVVIENREPKEGPIKEGPIAEKILELLTKIKEKIEEKGITHIDSEIIKDLIDLYKLRWKEIQGTKEDYTRLIAKKDEEVDYKKINKPWVRLAQILGGARLYPGDHPRDYYYLLMPSLLEEGTAAKEGLSKYPLTYYILSEDGRSLINLELSKESYQRTGFFGNYNFHPPRPLTAIEIERMKYAHPQFHKYIEIAQQMELKFLVFYLSYMLEDSASAKLKKVITELCLSKTAFKNIQELITTILENKEVREEAIAEEIIKLLNKIKVKNKVRIDGEIVEDLTKLYDSRWKMIRGTSEDYTRMQTGINKLWIDLAQAMSSAGLYTKDYYCLLMSTMPEVDPVSYEPSSSYPLSHYILSEDSKTFINLEISAANYRVTNVFRDCSSDPSRRLTAVEVERMRYANNRFHPYINIAVETDIKEDKPVSLKVILALYKLLNNSLYIEGLGFSYSGEQLSNAEKAYDEFEVFLSGLPENERQILFAQRIDVNKNVARFEQVLERIRSRACIAHESKYIAKLVMDYAPYLEFSADIERRVIEVRSPLLGGPYSLRKNSAGKTVSDYAALTPDEATRRLKILAVSLMSFKFHSPSYLSRPDSVSLWNCSNTMVEVSKKIYEAISPMLQTGNFSKAQHVYAVIMESLIKPTLAKASEPTAWERMTTRKAEIQEWVESIADQSLFSGGGLWFNPSSLMVALFPMQRRIEKPTAKAPLISFLEEIVRTTGMQALKPHQQEIRINIKFAQLLNSLTPDVRELVISQVKRVTAPPSPEIFYRTCADFLIDRLVHCSLPALTRPSILFFSAAPSADSHDAQRLKRLLEASLLRGDSRSISDVITRLTAAMGAIRGQFAEVVETSIQGYIGTVVPPPPPVPAKVILAC